MTDGSLRRQHAGPGPRLWPPASGRVRWTRSDNASSCPPTSGAILTLPSDAMAAWRARSALPQIRSLCFRQYFQNQRNRRIS